MREFYRSVRVESRAYIVQRCANNHEWYMALVEYGGGRWRGVIIVPEGQEGKGWSKFAVELRKVVAFFDSIVDDGSRGMVSRKEYDGSKMNGLSGTLLLPAKKDPMVDQGRRSYVDALVEKGQSQELEYSGKSRVGNSKEQIWKREDGYGRNEQNALPGIHGNKEGDDSLKISSAELGEVFELQSVRNLLVALKREVDHCLERLEVGHLSFGPNYNLPEKDSADLYKGVGNINLAPCSYKLGVTVGPKPIAIGGDQNI